MPDSTARRMPRSSAQTASEVDDEIKALLDHLGKLLAYEYAELLRGPASDSEDGDQ